jgi:Rrf2 family protein
MRFTQAAAYGISAVTYLANTPAGEIVSNTTICNVLQMPDRFVLQVMRLLVIAGIVKSTRGVYGGFQLAKPANKVTLLEIIEAVDGPIGARNDLALVGVSKEGRASVENALTAIEVDTRRRLAAVNLSDLRAMKAAVR